MFRWLFVGMAALLLSTVEAAPPSRGQWRAEPAFLRLFTPAYPPGAYEAYVSPDPIETILRQVMPDPALLHPPGAWTAVPTPAADAFGGEGTHNPWALSRLYSARRPLVARGPRGSGGRTVESWTLISPHPDLELRRLEPGTLLLIVRLP